MTRILLAFVKFVATFHFTRIKLPMKHIVYYFTNSNHNHEIQKKTGTISAPVFVFMKSETFTFPSQAHWHRELLHWLHPIR